MKIGVVSGSVWATRKAACLQGQTFLVVKVGEEQMVAADQLFMNPMKDSGRLEQALHDLDLSVLQGGALYVVTSMPSDDLKNCMETYLRGINCEQEFLVVRPEEEPVRLENMKVLALSDLEKGGGLR